MKPISTLVAVAASKLNRRRHPNRAADVKSPRPRRVRRVTVLGLFVALGVASGGVAQAAVVVQCVPGTAGQAVVSGGAGGTCPVGTTKVSLPASATDQQTLNSILPYLSFSAAGVSGKPTIKVHDANLQILSGSGSTAGAVNGQGNLVIGYDESPGTQTGSHNLMLGTNQTFSSYGAILGGSHNRATGAGSTVLGSLNTASGTRATVTGGHENVASAPYSSVSGGRLNTSSAGYSSVSGGYDNSADAGYSSVSGGRENLSSGLYASVTGGFSNRSTAESSAILGGCSNVISLGFIAGDSTECDKIGRFQTVSGGRSNTAEGSNSSISGGYKNAVQGDAGSILGGRENYVDQTSIFSSISGGDSNQVAGWGGSILGGHGRALAGQSYGTSQAGATVFAP